MQIGFTIVGCILLVVALVSIALPSNVLRRVIVLLLSVYVLTAMWPGYTVARHRAVETFDTYGVDTAKAMMRGVDAYYGAIADLRIGVALATAALIALAVASARK